MAGNTDMNSGMGKRIKLFVLAASAAIVIVGCQPSEGPIIEDNVPPGEQKISIRQLAATLGLRVSESNHTHVTLKKILIICIIGCVRIGTKHHR